MLYVFDLQVLGRDNLECELVEATAADAAFMAWGKEGALEVSNDEDGEDTTRCPARTPQPSEPQE